MNHGKVISVQGAGTWNSNHGMLYSFEYTVETADGNVTFNANHKTDKPKYNEGDEVRFEITGESEFGKRGKFLAPEQSMAHGSRQPRQSSDRDESIDRSVALKAAANVYAGSCVDAEQVIKAAEKFLVAWLQK